MSKKGITTTTSYLEWEKANQLIKTAQKGGRTKTALIIAIGIYTGLRIGDILQLKWIDILDRSTYDVTEQKTTKKRTITFNPDLNAIIKQSVKIISPKSLNEYVFLNYLGTKAISLQYINKQLKKEVTYAKYKMANVSSHFLRKTFGRRVWDVNNKSEEALVKLSEVFGHSNVAITRRYLGIRQEEIADVYLNL